MPANPSFRIPSSLLLFASAGLLLGTLVAATAAPGKPAVSSKPAASKEPAAAEGAQVLAKRCLSCHNAEKRAGGLDFSTRALAAASGLANRDDAAANPLVRVVTTGRMPPTGKLPADEIASLRAWVRSGLSYPAGKLEAHSTADEPLWSLQPVRRPAIPTTRFDALSSNPVDRFLFHRLQQNGLRPSPLAGKLELLRRVTLDLTGLPPTAPEIEAFQKDVSPNAYPKVVDRLLASPAYGERWGQHWLDVVRFGESHGYEQNHLRANAWPYRDYVIRSLNEDKPFDRFLTEQLAGDALAKGDPWTDAATGFLVAGIHDTVGNATEEGTRQKRANDLDDMVSTTAETFMGLTVGCAKCHDHKFDPIPQRDYYRLAAVFSGVQHAERPLGVAAVVTANGSVRFTEEFTPVTARFVRFTIQATADGSEPCLDELEVYGPGGKENLALATAGGKASASSLLPGYPIHQIAHLNDGQLGNERSWIGNEPGKGWAQVELAKSEPVSRIVWSRDAGGKTRLRDRVPSVYRVEVSENGQDWKVASQRNTSGSKTAVRAGLSAYAGTFTAPEPVYLLRRGDVMQRGDEVTPGALSRISGFPADLATSGTLTEPQRRLALAHWLTDPRNPLTARVIVNRIWHGHFGRGLVGTPSDFGHNGEKPTHPELLDYLAGLFTSRGADRETERQRDGATGSALNRSLPHSLPHGLNWSLKGLHRLLVTSYAYRQSSAVRADGQAKDAGNQLLWRMPLRRMEAESVRDAVLAVSGKLDRQMGGPGFQLFKYRVVNVAIYEPREEWGPDSWRRGVYRTNARAIRDDLLGTLDCPESSQRTPRRVSTTTALQALSLLNGSFMLQQAGFFAERVQQEAGADPAAQVDHAFRLAFGRPATAVERTAAVDVVHKEGLPALCRALFNANEFLYY